MTRSGVERMAAAESSPDKIASLPKPGALLGVDYGTRRIGIAVCNAEQTIAVPVETWISRTPELDRKHFLELVADYRVQGFVIGLPLMPQTGEEGRQAARTRTFGEWLRTVTGLPVVFWDERYSSAEAETRLWSLGEAPGRTKGRLDGLAAQVILQGYLDRHACHE
jgi:putative Holliday junction resolvase